MVRIGDGDISRVGGRLEPDHDLAVRRDKAVGVGELGGAGGKVDVYPAKGTPIVDPTGIRATFPVRDVHPQVLEPNLAAAR